MTPNRDDFGSLPNEIWPIIGYFIPIMDQAKLGRVSKRWRMIRKFMLLKQTTIAVHIKEEDLNLDQVRHKLMQHQLKLSQFDIITAARARLRDMTSMLPFFRSYCPKIKRIIVFERNRENFLAPLLEYYALQLEVVYMPWTSLTLPVLPKAIRIKIGCLSLKELHNIAINSSNIKRLEETRQAADGLLSVDLLFASPIMESLEHLNLWSWLMCTAARFTATHLTTVRLKFFKAPELNVFEDLMRSLNTARGLESLDIQAGETKGSMSFVSTWVDFFTAHRKLKKFVCKRVVTLPSVILHLISSRCPMLLHLDLTFVEEVHSQELMSLASLTHLEKLSLIWTATQNDNVKTTQEIALQFLKKSESKRTLNDLLFYSSNIRHAAETTAHYKLMYQLREVLDEFDRLEVVNLNLLPFHFRWRN